MGFRFQKPSRAAARIGPSVFPLNAPANQPSVTFAISAVDNNGLSNGVSGTFDTFSQNNFMIEAGDFDFNGGQWIDNPMETATINTATNSYYYYPGEQSGQWSGVRCGFHHDERNGSLETYLYRQESTGPGGIRPLARKPTSTFCVAS